MARTEFIKSARKTKRGTRPICCTCRQPIEVGQSYYKNSPSRFSSTYSWHAECKAPAPSQLEPNEKRSTAMAAQESAHEDLDALADSDEYAELVSNVESILEACAEGFNEAAGMCEESADNIESGFGHETESSELQREMAQTYESSADELTNWSVLSDMPERQDFDSDEEYADSLPDWRDEVIDSARSAVDDAEMP